MQKHRGKKRESKWVPWYTIELGKKKIVVEADVSKPPAQILEDQLIEIAGEQVKLEQVLKQVNARLLRLERKLNRMNTKRVGQLKEIREGPHVAEIEKRAEEIAKKFGLSEEETSELVGYAADLYVFIATAIPGEWYKVDDHYESMNIAAPYFSALAENPKYDEILDAVEKMVEDYWDNEYKLVWTEKGVTIHTKKLPPDAEVVSASAKRKKSMKSKRASSKVYFLRKVGFDKANLERWKKYWESLTGDVEHKFTKCVKKVKDAGFADDPEAFCAGLRDFVEGPEWRSRARKKSVKITAEEQDQSPAPEAPKQPEAPPAEGEQQAGEQKSEKAKIDLNTVLETASQILGVSTEALAVDGVSVDVDSGTMYVTLHVAGEGIKREAIASLTKEGVNIKLGQYDVTVPLGKQTVKYDIPTKTVNPLPQTKLPEFGTEDTQHPKTPTHSEPQVGNEPGKTKKQGPVIGVEASVKQNQELIEWVDKVVNLMVRKRVLPPEEKEAQKEFYLKRYSSVEPLKEIHDILSQVQDGEHLFVDDEGMITDLSSLFQ